MKADLYNPSELWGKVITLTLEASGVKQAVVCPGSRSTPLTLPLALSKLIRTYPILDERSAGFFALGLAKVTRKPVVLVCTSGTAAANFFPAVIEARLSGTPLLLLTADRPPELRDCSAGQTIRQPKIYGDYPVWDHELSVPDAEGLLLSYARETVRYALQRTLEPFPGPVHLNVPLRDPLVPKNLPDTSGAFPVAIASQGFPTSADEETPPLTRSFQGAGDQAEDTTALLPLIGAEGNRGLLIAGPLNDARDIDSGDALMRLAKHLNIPILADALSPLRHAGGPSDGVISHYDTILREASVAGQLQPDFVLQAGPLPTSKILRQWLSGLKTQTWILPFGVENPDPLHRPKQRFPLSRGELIQSLFSQTEAPLEAGYLAAWQRADHSVRSIVESVHPEPGARIREWHWPLLLSRVLRADTPLVIANSMPVRDFEWFWPAGKGQRPVFCNRGANGIDGTLSTALGVAAGVNKPTVLVTGELAFLHDSNGLLNCRHFEGRLKILVLNNQGGGIFRHLPIAQFEPPFRDYFLTPQEVDLPQLVSAHGLGYRKISCVREFSGAFSDLPGRGVDVVEVELEAEEDLQTRRELFTHITNALRESNQEPVTGA